MIRLELTSFGEEHTEAKCLCPNVTLESMGHPHDNLSLPHSIKVVFAGLLCCRVIMVPFPYSVPWRPAAT